MVKGYSAEIEGLGSTRVPRYVHPQVSCHFQQTSSTRRDQIEPRHISSLPITEHEGNVEPTVEEGYLISEEYGNVEFFTESGEAFEHLIQFLLSFRKFATTRIIDSK